MQTFENAVPRHAAKFKVYHQSMNHPKGFYF